MGSLIVYWSNLMPVTANHTCVCVAKSLLAGPVRGPHRLLCCVLHARFLSMLFVVCMCVLGVTYPMLTFGNPGKVTEDTPKVRPACCRACTARSGVLGKGHLTKFRLPLALSFPATAAPLGVAAPTTGWSASPRPSPQTRRRA